MICPNYKIKEVFDGFNEMIEALGGKPMTEEEFRSSELRNLRTGRDYSAMEAAYKMYHRNNGNMPDVAPNGKHSILFDSLLKYFDGDRQKAIVAKSRVYSSEFFNRFGDWTKGNNESIESPKVKFYGATMGKTTASKMNKNLVDFDDIVRLQIKELADKKGISVRELKIQSGPEYRNLLLTAIKLWKSNPDNNGKTLVVSNAAMAKEQIFDNIPSLPSKEEFVKRQVGRGEGDEKAAELYYDDLVNKWMPDNFKTDNRYVSEIEGNSEAPQVLEAYQGYDNLDNRTYNYWTLDEKEANTYGKKVRKRTINTKGFLNYYTDNNAVSLRKEFKQKTGKTFDILDNSEEGLKTQEEFFDFLKDKGYSGISFIASEDQEDNRYLVSFDNTSILYDENDGEIQAIKLFANRLGFEITKNEDAMTFIDFTKKVISMRDFSSEEFLRVQAKIATTLIPKETIDELIRAGGSHGVKTWKDIENAVYDCLNNGDTFINKDKNLYRKIIDFISDLINKFLNTQSYYESLIKQLATDIADENSKWFNTFVLEGFELKGLDVKKLEESPQYHIYDVLTKLGASLDGSAAVRLQGSLYRKGEEDFHDLDFTKKYDDFSWDIKLALDKFFKEYLDATYNFKKRSRRKYMKLRNQMLEECDKCLKRSEIYKKLSEHYGEIYVKHAAKTKQLGLFVTLSIDGTPVDIFYTENVIQHEVNGIKVTDFSSAFAAKIIMGRDKDIRDIINFHKFKKQSPEPRYKQQPNQTHKPVDKNGEPLIENIGILSTKNDNVYHENQIIHEHPLRDKRLYHLYDSKKELTIHDLLAIIKEDKVYSKILNFLSERGYKNNRNRKPLLHGILFVVKDTIASPSAKILFNGRRAYYSADNNTIYIDAFADFENGNSASVLLHELLHAITVSRILSSPELREKFVSLINKYQREYKKDHGHYNLKYDPKIDEHWVEEFIADVWSDYDLMVDLAYYKSDNNNSLWNKIKQFFSKIILGEIREDSMFAEATQLIDTLLDSDELRHADGKFFAPGSATHSADKIRKSAENIRHRFGVLYRTYEKMPNKSPLRQKLANEIFEIYGKIKRINNFEAVTNAMDFAERKLGLKDDSTDGVLQWLLKNDVNNFENVSAEQIVDVMQNSIGFFKDLLTYFPPDSYMTEDSIERRNKISGYLNGAIYLLWSKAVYAVSDRIVDSLVDRWFTGTDEDRQGMKEVAKDWLHKNAMYGDISSAAAFLQNYQYSENPITKQVFHLIQVAETRTGMELLPISARISKAYLKANKDFGRINPAWLKIFMELDRDGVPTGNFVRDINYGQYEKDRDEFIALLNKEFKEKYGHSYEVDSDDTYINTATGGLADDEEWIDGNPPHIIEYKLRIEEWKCQHSNRRYTFEYYKERMSEPYSGPDPNLTNLTGNFKHGLSPKTLSKYNRIQSNINYYMSLCYDPKKKESHPENLSDSDWLKLESFRKELETLSNPYNEDGSPKTGEDYQAAIEIRAWEKWIGQKLDTNVDIQLFEDEANEILSTKGIDAYNKFIKYNSKIGINPNLIAQTIKQFGLSEQFAEAIHARLLRTSLLKLVQSKKGYTRDLYVLENNPQFWQECKKTDLIIEDCRTSRGKDFALMMANTFSSDLIEYRDAYGNAYDLNGTVVPRDKEKDTQLMTYYDYMINKYTSEILNSPTRTINGLYDRTSGGLFVFSGTDADVRNTVTQLFTYRRVIHNEDGSTEIRREPLTIFTLLTPLEDTFINHRTGMTERSITNVPSGRFSTKYDFRHKYLTDPAEYDYTSQIAEQPKRDIYDNSEAFNRVKGSAKDLYDVLIDVCSNTLLLYKLNGTPYNYRLPMINAQSMALLSRLKSDGYRNVSRAIFDAITTIEENDENMRTKDQFATNPDGTVATDIPLKFIRPLEDMRRLSTDVASMVVMFAEMGLNYKNKQQIESSIKALRYNMESSIRTQQQRLADEEYAVKSGENSKQQFDNMTAIHLYGNDWNFGSDSNTPNSRVTVAGLKAARLIQRYETLHMLGLNILSMLVGACDAGVKQIREVINGKYARPADMVKGLIRCIEHTPSVIANISCPLANNKLTGLMLIFRISKGTRATYEHMNWSRLHKLAALFFMGGFSMLDYMMNGLLLMTHMSNVRFYEGSADIPAGFYTLYELQRHFINAGKTKSEATLTHLFLKEDLYNAFEFDSDEGACRIKPQYQQYVNDDVFTQIRTKTISRGALYNGMNPDNDLPKARKKIWSAFVLSMRGWLTQAYQHLMSGGTDNIPITKEQRSEFLTRYGVTRRMNYDYIHNLTNEQRSRRSSWNYETGTPQDQILVGLFRAFGTTYKYCMTNMFRNIPDRDPRKVKFSYAEKYAAKDAIVYLAVLGFMLATFPLVNDWAGDVPPPDEEDPKFLDDPYTYVTDIFVPRLYYRLALADIYFRTIESSISSVDPTTALDFVTSATVLYSGYKEQADFLMAGRDLLGFGDGSLGEKVNRGGYRLYTKGERILAKGLGFLDNIHTAFDFYGLDANLQFYLGKYGGIYRRIGYDYKRKYKGNKPSRSGGGLGLGRGLGSGGGLGLGRGI